MAKIRVTCPACSSELELDEAFVGQEVECGSCGRVFVARDRAPEPGSRPGAEPPSDRPEPRERDDRPKRPDRERDERRKRDDRDRERDDRDESDDRDERDRDDEPEERRPPRRPAPRRRRPPTRSRRRRLDGSEPRRDDEYEDYEPPEREGNAYNGLATTSLVLGLISFCLVLLTLPFTCCCALLPLPFTIPLSLAATVTGGFGLKSDSDRKPLAVVGLLLGLLCLGFAALELGFGIVPRLR